MLSTQRQSRACYIRNLPVPDGRQHLSHTVGYDVYDKRPSDTFAKEATVKNDLFLILFCFISFFLFQRLKEHTHYTDSRRSLYQQH